MRSTGRAGGSAYSRPSDSAARSVRLRQRLRLSGVMASSRSALSRHDAVVEDFLVVDVGEGKTPNMVEQLIARLEQHGLRRCLTTDSDVTEYRVGTCVDTSHEHVVLSTSPQQANVATQDTTAAANDEAEGRDPYFYLCVPCETRLTSISNKPATQRMLEDLHHHFSSASHREAASWMADPDIDETLGTSPLIEDPNSYGRIYTNGIPLLLSRRPGGGDMFFPLPHEVERVSMRKLVRRASLGDEPPGDTTHRAAEEAMDKVRLFPSQRYSSSVIYWYRPLTSMNPESKQLVAALERGMYVGPAPPPGSTQRVAAIRRSLHVDHIPTEDYLNQTRLDKHKVPVDPAVFILRRSRLPKSFLSRKRERDTDEVDGGRKSTGEEEGDGQGGCRTYYVQDEEPYVELKPFVRTPEWQDRCLVEANSVCRVALVSRLDAAVLADMRKWRQARSESAQRTSRAESAPQVPTLTQELLSQVTSYMPFRQYQTVGTSMGSHVGAGSYADGAARSSSVVSGSASGDDSSANHPSPDVVSVQSD